MTWPEWIGIGLCWLAFALMFLAARAQLKHARRFHRAGRKAFQDALDRDIKMRRLGMEFESRLHAAERDMRQREAAMRAELLKRN